MSTKEKYNVCPDDGGFLKAQIVMAIQLGEPQALGTRNTRNA